MKCKKSQKLFERALKIIPGGVNSPVRAFNAVGGEPLFIDKAKGSRIYDVDQNETYKCSRYANTCEDAHRVPPQVPREAE